MPSLTSIQICAVLIIAEGTAESLQTDCILAAAPGRGLLYLDRHCNILDHIDIPEVFRKEKFLRRSQFGLGCSGLVVGGPGNIFTRRASVYPTKNVLHICEFR